MYARFLSPSQRSLNRVSRAAKHAAGRRTGVVGDGLDQEATAASEGHGLEPRLRAPQARRLQDVACGCGLQSRLLADPGIPGTLRIRHRVCVRVEERAIA